MEHGTGVTPIIRVTLSIDIHLKFAQKYPESHRKLRRRPLTDQSRRFTLPKQPRSLVRQLTWVPESSGKYQSTLSQEESTLATTCVNTWVLRSNTCSLWRGLSGPNDTFDPKRKQREKERQEMEKRMVQKRFQANDTHSKADIVDQRRSSVLRG